MRHARIAVLVSVAVSFAAPSFVVNPCFAQAGKPAAKPAKRKPIREELPDSARKDWDAAKDLFEAQDFQGALVEYRRAYELSKNPRVLFNVGVCEKNLRKYARASATWKKQLQEMSGNLSAAEEQEIKEAIAALEVYVSTVEVTANEADATLLIDNDEAGKTPFAAPLPIDVGRHTLRLKKDGFQEQTLDVNVAAGKGEKVTFKIEPTTKKSLVSIQVVGVTGANVIIDGVDMGPAPFKGEVQAGRHTFEARSPGFVTARQTSDVVYKEPLNLTLSMSTERHEGRVKVTVDHKDAILEIDGKVVGSGWWEGALPSGGHQLVVVKNGYQTYSSDLAVSDDQVRTVNVTLQAEQKGVAWFWWTAGTVAILGAGTVAGYMVFKPQEPTPVSGSLAPGLVTTRLH